MSFQFLIGPGHLNDKAAEIAVNHGSRLINHVDPGCSCGYGCLPSQDCPANKRHWFETQNLGEPHDSAIAEAIELDLRAAGVLNE